jgi:ABC-2 type transport system permease protein
VKGPAKAGAPEVVLCFDPAIHGINRRFIVSAVRSVIIGVELNMILAGGGETAEETKSPPAPRHETVKIRETFAGRGKAILPTSVQENVPAWTLFAMFLIVIPVSGLIIKERSQGTLARLRTLPVSAWTLLLGNLIVYVVLCLLQFAVMLLIGLLVLPRLGTPRLEMGNSTAAMVLVAFASALAATGFGMMVANLARSNDFAAFFSSTFTVIAAVLGGVMVPVFLMPPGIQAISRFSPLNWGLNGFLEVFLRGGGVKAVLPDVLRLTAFFAVTLAIAVACFKRRESSSWPRPPEWRER